MLKMPMKKEMSQRYPRTFQMMIGEMLRYLEFVVVVMVVAHEQGPSSVFWMIS